VNDPPAPPRRAPRDERRHSRSGARSVARRLGVQALYRLQLNEGPWQDALAEFDAEPDMAKADRDYFRELVRETWGAREALDARLAAWLDRKPGELDPVEHAALLAAAWELQFRPDVPWRVVVSEAVTIARRYGATDGHKFVNAVLDRAARELRPHEH
jgi:N utilization substance protein B